MSTLSRDKVVAGLASLIVCLAPLWPAGAQEAATQYPPRFQIAPYANGDDIAEAKDQIERGKLIYDQRCAMCHGTGHEHPGTESLEARYGDTKPAALALRNDLPPNVTKYYVRTGAGPMPFFRKADITDSELDDIAAFLARNVPKAGQ